MRKSELTQYYAGFVTALGNLVTAMMLVWPSYSLPVLKADQTILGTVLTEYDCSLIGSLPMLGCLLSTLMTKLTIDGLGRFRSQIFAGLLFVLSWSLIITTRSLTILLIARFILGFASGLTMALSCVMVGEISSDRIRGTLMVFPVFGYNTGYLVSYLLGWFCSYQVTIYVMVVISVAYTVMGCTMKETPIYLLQKGFEKKALQSLMFYRGNWGSSVKTQEILDEFEVIKLSLDKPVVEMKPIQAGKLQTEDSEKLQAFLEEGKSSKSSSQSAWKYIITSKTTQRGLVTVSLLFSFLVFMGSLAVQTYAGDFFMQSVPDLSPDLCSVILALANMVGCFMSMTLIESLGRRILQVSSCFLNCVALLTVGSVLRWHWVPTWTIPLMMLVSCAAVQLGAGAVPPVLTGEIFLPEFKGLGTTIVLSVLMASNFVLLAAFVPSVSVVGLDGIFFLFGGIAALATLVSYILTPETSGLSASQVQELLSRGWAQFKYSGSKK